MAGGIGQPTASDDAARFCADVVAALGSFGQAVEKFLRYLVAGQEEGEPAVVRVLPESESGPVPGTVHASRTLTRHSSRLWRDRIAMDTWRRDRDAARVL